MNNTTDQTLPTGWKRSRVFPIEYPSRSGIVITSAELTAENERKKMKAWKIEGHEAIRIAERDGVTIHKYADPTDGHRSGVSVSEAIEIAKEDAHLIYCIVQPVGWTGDATGYNVADYFSGAKYLGPDADGIEPTWSDANE